MASIAYLGNFNNYFNRQVKYQPSFETLAGYQTYTNNEKLLRQTSINFNPNDGITTELIVNWNPALDWTPDYVLVLDDSVIYNSGENPIVSRWFVTEFERTRNGQYKMMLKRDSIADNYGKVIAAPAYIEKATLNASNPLIFNNENMQFNQIKKEEILLKDETKMPWIVGYCSKDENRHPETGYYQTEMDIGPVILKSELPTKIANLIDAGNCNIAVNPDNSTEMDYEFYTRWDLAIPQSIYPNIYLTYLKWHFHYNYDNYIETMETTASQIADSISLSGLTTDLVDIGVNVLFMDESDWDSLGLMNSVNFKSIVGNILYQAQIEMSERKGPINKNLREGLGCEESSYLNQLLRYNGVTYFDQSTNKYYRLKMDYILSKTGIAIYGNNDSNKYQNVRNFVFQAFDSAAQEAGISTYTNPDATDSDTVLRFNFPYYNFIIEKEEVPAGSASTTSAFISSGRRRLVDAPYDMFCIPYGALKCSSFTCDPEISLAAAQSLAQAQGVVYDIQILPYCPLRGTIVSDTVYELSMTEGRDFDYITYTEGGQTIPKSIIFWCRDSSFTFNIVKNIEINRPTEDELTITRTTFTYQQLNQTISVGANQTVSQSYTYLYATNTNTRQFISVKDISVVEGGGGNNSLIRYNAEYNPISGKLTFHWKNNTGNTLTVRPKAELVYDVVSYPHIVKNPLHIDTKISNQCDIYRLNSPNFASSFDFSVAKNNGIDFFNVDCTYKPYSPYIHINPNFKNLYGQDFNDARGLICNGDFSLTLVSDAWQTYQLQNKNYQLIFNRQIENLDVMRDISRTKDILGVLGGSAGGAASGAAMGAKAGPYGAIAGAAVGGVVGTAGGLINYSLNEKAYKENRDFKIDEFNYSLGNVQALPNTLTQVGVLNENFKFFPFIEYYTCTDKEKEAFANKLKWNGMTVMMIGTISEYMRAEESFMKGKFIRLEGLNDDSHIANDIYQEFDKGIFIGGTSGS